SRAFPWSIRRRRLPAWSTTGGLPPGDLGRSRRLPGRHRPGEGGHPPPFPRGRVFSCTLCLAPRRPPRPGEPPRPPARQKGSPRGEREAFRPAEQVRLIDHTLGDQGASLHQGREVFAVRRVAILSHELLARLLRALLIARDSLKQGMFVANLCGVPWGQPERV